MNENYSSFTEKLIKHTILFYVLMVFLSFFQIYSYHHYFDIEINSYYTLYEYLICFIPAFIIPFISVLIKWWYVWLIILLLYQFDLLFFNNKFSEIFKRLWAEPYSFFTTGRLKISSSCFKCWRALYYVFSSIYIFFISYLIINLLIILLSKEVFEGCYLILTRDFIDPYGVNKWWFRIAFFLWSVFIYINVSRCVKKFPNYYQLRFSFNLVFIILIMFAFSSVKTSKIVAMKFNRLNGEYVEFYYKNKKVKTNYARVLVGGTKDYIFIRDFTINETVFYNMNSISYLKFSK